jgi:hypothetical protein
MDGHRYTLSVLELVNSLSKPNSAVLQIKRTPHSRQPQFEVDQDIERLIQHVEASDLTFVLEGTTVAGSEAGAQLRRKWRYAGTRFTNVNDFIERIANRSPATAEPYLAELVDGSNLRMRDWLREQWKELRSTSIQ